ncbi:hypothetical protein ACQCN2_00945 [Brevibacillus ginsengisoli]|uniref:hypothetical protein n=1 Tax=Brevibacillus ginsengisoli TaxID=363854 RepID=UPI003CFAFFAE
MEKSFYYLVPVERVNRMQRKFLYLDIPYFLEAPGQRLLVPENYVAFVFPDLPVKQYAILRLIFGFDGLPYPSQ